MAARDEPWVFRFADGTVVAAVEDSTTYQEISPEGHVRFTWAWLRGVPPTEALELFDSDRSIYMRISADKAELSGDGAAWSGFDVSPGAGSAGTWCPAGDDAHGFVVVGGEHQPTAFKFDCGGGMLAERHGEVVVWTEHNAAGSPSYSFTQASAVRTSAECWELLIQDAARGCCVRLVSGMATLFFPSHPSEALAARVLSAKDFSPFSPREGADSCGSFVASDPSPSVSVLLGQTGRYGASGAELPPMERQAKAWAFAVAPENYLSIAAVDPVAATRNPFRARALRLQAAPAEAAGLLAIPTLDAVRSRLPRPHWPANDTAVRCYWRVWELAFDNLTPRKVPAEARSRTRVIGLPFPFADTAFSDCLFLWDSIFILAFARYARRACGLWQGTMDNFYATALQDGFISKELRPSGHFQYHPHDPCSTGPNLLAWCEWDHYRATGDLSRLADVFWPLVSYHRWTRSHRTWQNGTYWSNGLACGMDNIPRADRTAAAGDDLFARDAAAGAGAGAAGSSSASAGAADVTLHCPWFSHGHMSWVDATAQALLSAECILAMARVLQTARPAGGIAISGVADMASEAERLLAFLQDTAWSPATALFHDVEQNGERTAVRHVGGYWPLLAGAATAGAATRVHRAGNTPIGEPDAALPSDPLATRRAAAAGAAAAAASSPSHARSAAVAAAMEGVPKPPPVLPAPYPRPRQRTTLTLPPGVVAAAEAADAAAAAASAPPRAGKTVRVVAAPGRPAARAASAQGRSDSDVGIGTDLLRDVEIIARSGSGGSGDAEDEDAAEEGAAAAASSSQARTPRPPRSPPAPRPAALPGIASSQLLALPSARRMAELLHDPEAFGCAVAVPSLARDDPCFDETGGYWRGGVWSPTTYMVLRGLRRAGLTADEHAIALRHCEAVWKVFETTGTVHENYAPVKAAPGRPAKPDFVGWSGLGPVALLIESVFGITVDWPTRTLVWVVRLADEFGIDELPVGPNGVVSLRCAKRSSTTEPPSLTVTTDSPLKLIVRWPAGDAPSAGERSKTVTLSPGSQEIRCSA